MSCHAKATTNAEHYTIFNAGFSQNVGIGTNTPQAALDITSITNGFLPPRMTYAQRNAIVNPVAGLIVYYTDCGTNGGEPQYFNGTSWFNLNGNIATSNLPSITNCNQVWTTQNLSVNRYKNGDTIPNVTNTIEWRSLTTGAWCWYNNDSVNYSQYGKLYNWYAVNDPRGLAPTGWHIASDAEWNKLIKCIEPLADTTCQSCYQSTTAGGAIKETGTLHWLSPNTGATNSTGFAGLPGGSRNDVGTFGNIGNVGYWWTSTKNNSAWNRSVDYNYAGVFRSNGSKTNGFSVRLVSD